MIVLAPISVGELIDKITILEIKLTLLTDPAKLENVKVELDELNKVRDSLDLPPLHEFEKQLKVVNEELWNIEDFKRRMEKEQKFDEGFIAAARWVYLKNDIRAAIKREINKRCGSLIVEEKSYK
jgi:hypothetical protein